jgi:1-deoxy-D-xylulose-5-phosphate reductoisomerase
VQQRTLTILGATGSVGTSTLDLVARHAERFKIYALTAQRQVERMAMCCERFLPRVAVMGDEASATALRAHLRAKGVQTEVQAGAEALEAVAAAPEADTVMAAIVGAAGLKPTLAAALAGKRVLLANKEALVTAGALFMEAVRSSKALLLPIDSEHNAILQALPSGFAGNLAAVGVRRILLTASGGPFRTTPLQRLRTVSADEACAHPNWIMGRKISVDSATMMNKGLEVIEARWLFDAAPEQIEVVIHPQSVIHSMVEYVDGSVLAQLGHPDMRTPIAHALAWPERMESGVRALNFFEVGGLSFEKPDLQRFPCLALAYAALRSGGTAPAVLNAANEIAVGRFLEGSLPFDRIASVVEDVMGRAAMGAVKRLEDVLEADRAARELARAQVAA